MALIECSHCSKKISSTAKSCPKCGGVQGKIKSCPECFSICKEDALICNECGFTLKRSGNSNIGQNLAKGSKKVVNFLTSRTLKRMVVGLLICLLVGSAAGLAARILISPVNYKNFLSVKIGDTVEQVETVLGHKYSKSKNNEVYIWTNKEKYIELTIKDNKVVSKKCEALNYVTVAGKKSDEIKNGISLEEVEKILDKGTLKSQDGNLSEYSWNLKNGGIVIVDFKDNIVTNINYTGKNN